MSAFISEIWDRLIKDKVIFRRMEGAEGQRHTFLALALSGGEKSASRPGRLIPMGKSPRTHWTGEWMSPRFSLIAKAKKKNPSLPLPEIGP